MPFRLSPSAAATAALIVAGFVLCVVVNFPGHLSFNSVVQLFEGRTGIYGNWHPPMMSWLLEIFDAIMPGTGLFVIFDAGLLFASLAGLLWLNPRPSLAAAAVLALCLLTPQFLLYQGIVWKDVLFADLSVAGFVCLAVAGERWPRQRWRFALAALGFGLLIVATLVRQNGALVLPAGAATLAWFAWTQSARHKNRAAATYGLCALIGASLAVIAIHSALALRVAGNPSPTVQFRLLQFYDLIGALKTEPTLALPRFDDDDPELEQLMRSDGVRLYTAQRNDTLVQSARLQRAYFDSPDDIISAQWHDLIVQHPGLYLRVRSEVFRWIVLTPDLAACRPIYTGVSGPPQMMRRLGLTTRFDGRDTALGNYSQKFMGTPVFSHGAYAVLALGLLVVLFARRRAADIALAFLLLAAFAFTASFFVISIACDYRYLYVLDLATLVAAFHVALDWRTAWAAVRPQHFR